MTALGNAPVGASAAKTAGTPAARPASTSGATSGATPCEPQRRRGAALEDAILAAAYDELSEVGYTAFTVEGVAARARTGKASIYRRWPRRSELLLDAICARLPTAAECGIDAIIPDEQTTADALREVARNIADVMRSPAGDVMRAIKCEAVIDAELASAIDERFQAPRREFMMSLVRRGIARGEVRPDADPRLVADVLPAILTYRIILQREPLTADAITQIMEQVMIPLLEPR